MKKRVLITGATGFIGSNLVPTLLDTYDVHVLTRGGKKPWKGVTYHQSDLRNGIPDAAIGDYVIHLASTIAINESLATPRERIHENISADLALLEAIRNSGKSPLVVFTSTDRLYGKSTKREVNEHEHPFPLEPYTASKIMGEVALQAYAHLYDIPYIVLRLDSVYGPRQPKTMFISDMIQKMLATDMVTTGPLTVKKNFVYVGDVVAAIHAALRASKRAHNRAYNIGSEHVSLKHVASELVRVFKDAYKRKIRVVVEPRPPRPSKIEVAPFRLSTKEAYRFLKWKPRTPLYKGLQQTVEYFTSL